VDEHTKGVDAVTSPRWDPRRLTAVDAQLPEGVAPPGTAGRILLSALRLFAEYGFHGTSIRDIAAGIGINSATLYAHFPSKAHILAALVQIGHEELHQRMQQALVDAGPEPADQLVALVRAQVLAHADYPLLALVANQELHALSPDHAAPSLALRELSRDLGLRVLRRGVERGAFAVGDITLAATAIGAMGVRVASWFGPHQPYTREQVADTFAQYALQIAGAHVPAGTRKG
jgi:AcrR family transcriptional regulator